MGASKSPLAVGIGVIALAAIGLLLVVLQKAASGRKDSETDEVALTGSDPDLAALGEGTWVAYASTTNGERSKVIVDLTRKEQTPDPVRPHVLWVVVQMKEPASEGSTSSAEAATLRRLEEAIRRSVRTACSAELVGREISGDRRESYFYGPGAQGLEAAVAGALKFFPDCEAGPGSKADPEWTIYLGALYPQSSDLRRIRNRDLYAALRRGGDQPQVSRRVIHAATFPTRDGRDAFVEQVGALGYREIQGSRTDADGHFTVRVEKESKTDPAVLDPATIEVEEAAIGAGGSYGGWETSVEAPR